MLNSAKISKSTQIRQSCARLSFVQFERHSHGVPPYLEYLHVALENDL